MARSPLWSWRVLRLHITLVALGISFGLLADWQIHRALAGNTLSWAYAFEWPLFIIYAVVLWRRLLLDELHIDRKGTQKRRLTRLPWIANYQRRRLAELTRRSALEDLKRERYNDYLAALHAEDDAPSTPESR